MLILTSEQLHIVQDILCKYLPEHTTAWVFGSRATGRARQFSDLDLLFDAKNTPLPTHILLNIAEAFDESPLPYKVDLVDWNGISDAFKEHIRNDRQLLNW